LRQGKKSRRVDNFVIQIDSLIDLTKEQRKGVEDAVDLCLVHNTPVHPPKIEKPAQAATKSSQRT
jgi:putative redox protein